MQKTISDQFETKKNNFDVIRLFAAVLVIFGHSYALTGGGLLDPFEAWNGYRESGNLAVCVFFVISGFLVARSLERNDVLAYTMARILRIFPALFVVVFVQVFVLGPLFTSLSFRQYFSSVETFNGLRSIFVFDVRFILPGVFEENAYPGVVNGSLWTLPIETLFYLMLPWLGLTGLFVPSKAWLVAIGLVLLRVYSICVGIDSSDSSLVFNGVPAYHAIDFGLVFFSGVLMWVYRNKIPLSGGLALCALFLLFAGRKSNAAIWVFYVTVPYLVIYMALAFHVDLKINKLGDISYGVYIYAFPVQQSLVALFDIKSPSMLTISTLPIVFVLALLSWKLVESPALRFKIRAERKISKF